jgi:hypothetical protein
MVLQLSCNGVTRVLYWCCKGVTIVLQECYQCQLHSGVLPSVQDEWPYFTCQILISGMRVGIVKLFGEKLLFSKNGFKTNRKINYNF